MIYPTINELSRDQYNRYEIALATAKCARRITNEYVRQRKEAEHAAAGAKDSDRSAIPPVDREMRDEKAVKIAIARIHRGEYAIVHKDPEEQEKEERAILEGMMQAQQEPYFFGVDMTAEDADEEDADEALADDEIDEILGMEDDVADGEVGED